MSPARLKSFPLNFVKETLSQFGIYLLDQFPDGQVRWGDGPLPEGEKFKGRSMMSSPYEGEMFDILTIRSVVSKLQKEEQWDAIHDKLDEFFQRDEQ